MNLKAARKFLQLKGIVMIARDNACRCRDEPVSVRDGSDVGGLGFPPSLIRHCLTAFLGWRVAAIEIEVMHVDLFTDAQAALL